MSDYLKGKTIRLRCKKNYTGAHTHVIIGRVEEENDRYIAILGRSFHFGRLVDGLKNQITAGATTIRILPWENVELVHWLDDKTDWSADFGFDTNGNLVLHDRAKTIIAERRDGIE